MSLMSLNQFKMPQRAQLFRQYRITRVASSRDHLILDQGTLDLEDQILLYTTFLWVLRKLRPSKTKT